MDAGLLTTIRAAAQEQLVDVAQIQRNTPVSDGMGGETAGYVGLTPTLLCRVQEVMTTERESGAILMAVGKKDVVLPWNADVRQTDRIVVGASTFEVEGTNGDQTERATLVAYCKEVA